jgi:MoCo/4Fe-4S cofactor protein with predicted Tat translocation signal
MSEDSNAKNSIDLAAARAKLAGAGAARMWQSLEQLSGTQKFEEFRDYEFPPSAGKGNDGIDRRDVLKLMAASAAMAGLSACTKLPTEKIVPYVKPPEEILAGRPLFYATSLFQAGVATGVLVESHTGRPTKIEGNSEHPGSLGSRPVAVGLSGRARQYLERFRREDGQLPHAAPAKGLWPADSDRNDNLAHARRTDEDAAGPISGGEVASI